MAIVVKWAGYVLSSRRGCAVAARWRWEHKC
jgi:hypothetical protein